MSRILSAFFWLCLFGTFCLNALASPVTLQNATRLEEARDLEKRVDRTGRVTWFHAGLGNCGKRSTDSEPVVAMGKAFYDRNKGSNCGQWVEIVNIANGKMAYGQLWDSCPSCSDSQIDVSPSLFQKLAPLSQGVLTARWHFMNKNWKP